MSNGNYIVDYGKNFMNVDADKWMALQAIHGAVHAAMIGVKYTWFGMVGCKLFKSVQNVDINSLNLFLGIHFQHVFQNDC